MEPRSGGEALCGVLRASGREGGGALLAFNARRLDLCLTTRAPGDVHIESLSELVQVDLHGRWSGAAGDSPLLDEAPRVQRGAQVRWIQVHAAPERLAGRFGHQLRINPARVSRAQLDHR